MTSHSATRALFTKLTDIDPQRNYIFDQFPKGNELPCEWYLNYAEQFDAVINDNATMRNNFPAELPSTLANTNEFFDRASAGEINWELVVLQQCTRRMDGDDDRGTDEEDDDEYNPELTVLQSKRLVDFDVGQQLAAKFPYRKAKKDTRSTQASADRSTDDHSDAETEIDDEQSNHLSLNNRILAHIAAALGELSTNVARLTNAHTAFVEQHMHEHQNTSATESAAGPAATD